MRDRLEPCIYYICKDADCKKGFVKVDMRKCKTGNDLTKINRCSEQSEDTLCGAQPRLTK